MAYDLGDTVTLDLTVKDSTDTLVNASTNVLTITLPDNTTTSPTATNPSTGYYLAAYVPTLSGHYSWRWPTTGPATGESGSFNVADALPPLIISLQDARDYLSLPGIEKTSDVELRGFIEAATRLIELHVGPVVRRTATFTVNRYGCVALPYDPLSLTSGALIRSGTAVDVTNMVVENGVLRSKTYTPLPIEPWTLTCVVGRTIIGANILKAAAEVVSDLWASQRGASIRAGESQRIPYALSYKALNLLEPDTQLGVA